MKKHLHNVRIFLLTDLLTPLVSFDLVGWHADKDFFLLFFFPVVASIGAVCRLTADVP